MNKKIGWIVGGAIVVLLIMFIIVSLISCSLTANPHRIQQTEQPDSL